MPISGDHFQATWQDSFDFTDVISVEIQITKKTPFLSSSNVRGVLVGPNETLLVHIPL